MNLTRYELEFFGEPQEIGFIQGLKDQGLSDKTIDKLIENFDTRLNIPNFEEFQIEKAKEQATSYFTEKGLETFGKDIKKIIKFIEKQDNGFSVVAKEISVEKNDINILYRDEYQVILRTLY